MPKKIYAPSVFSIRATREAAAWSILEILSSWAWMYVLWSTADPLAHPPKRDTYGSGIPALMALDAK